MDPGNIKQLLEQNGKTINTEIIDHETLPESQLIIKDEDAEMYKTNIKDTAEEKVRNGSVDDIITQELKDAKSNHQDKPDSSNGIIFPPQNRSSIFPNPLALTLATSQIALGLDLSQRIEFQKRRKSDPSTPFGSDQSRVSSVNSGSTLINSSTGAGNLYAHYPPTEDPSRPFGCTQCQKRFRMKHHLKEHMLIHSGEMPFSCHLCPKRFNRSYTLKNHMKLHSQGSIVDKFQNACT